MCSTSPHMLLARSYSAARRDLPQSSYLLSPIVPCALFRKTYPVIRTSGGVSVTRTVLVLLVGSSAFTACRVSHQTIEGQPPLPMAKKSNYQNRCGQKRNRQPQLRHRVDDTPPLVCRDTLRPPGANLQLRVSSPMRGIQRLVSDPP